MSMKSISRRDLLRTTFALGAATTGLVVLGCSKKETELACTDTNGLAPGDVAMRTTLGYADKTPDPAKACKGCNFFKAAGEGQCGSCTLIKGPINPGGTCKSWAPKV